ncbi:hypothetical protein M406DRAFT_269081 [Cryphonectria parasitica EP155]|uniref:Nicotinamide N-methyltransferase n=1 Tax=Cryphonectria parasitica (strain ATCC 38755 / EP155) TaxID=660469 RepID=A0A9P4XSJ0_CRYP1|nr:uncharacterized protein M406DRAFT_269081 [Cryphonectria parasitica EP155]KAF3760141.1 hypothetical protein M406DRAFT_269081 [Cryphonectria parasitica EP155]
MSLALRLTPAGEPLEDPEDFFGDSLGVVFEDDTMNLHGDADHGLLYTSPHLPKPLHISLADPAGDEDRQLFSHYLWNASLLLAEFVEAGTLIAQKTTSSPLGPALTDFDITGLTTIELGAGTALPSLLAALYGAERVVITDYPAPAILANLRDNAARNLLPAHSPLARVADFEVVGHAWGDLDSSSSSSSSSPPTTATTLTSLAATGRGAFDRVFICDCLWMPWQHDNLLRSVAWFLRAGREARCWCVAGFHSGRAAMRGFLEAEKLAGVGLEVERIWERDCDGVERAWEWDRGIEDPAGRKRWLAFAVLRRMRVGDEEDESGVLGGGGGGGEEVEGGEGGR